MGITPEGAWVLTDGDPDALAINDRQWPAVTMASGAELALPADPQRAGQLIALPAVTPGPTAVLGSV